MLAEEPKHLSVTQQYAAPGDHYFQDLKMNQAETMLVPAQTGKGSGKDPNARFYAHRPPPNKPMPEGTLRMAIYQGAFSFGKKDKNLKTIKSFAGHAADAKINLVIFPELSLTGYTNFSKAQLVSIAEFSDGPSIQEVKATAKQHGVNLIYGYIEKEKSSDKHFSTTAVISQHGEVLVQYRKTHLTHFETFIFTPGAEIADVFEINGVKVGLLVCFDIFYPEVSRVLAVKGAQVLAIPAANGNEPELFFASTKMVPTRAVENGVFVAYVNYAQTGGVVDFCGMSRIVDPDGATLAMARGYPPNLGIKIDNSMVEFLVAKADPSKYPFNEHRRPKLYGDLCSS